MPTIAEIRTQYPQYNDLSDDALAGALHKKFYSDMPEADFHAKIGMKPATAATPSVPMYTDYGGKEIRIDRDATKTAELETFQKDQAAFKQGQAEEQAAFDASRTPMTRVKDTATFAASLPVRMLTQGEKGIGDVAGLVSPETGNRLLQSEATFARANEGKNALSTWDPRDIASLATLNAVGAVAPGVPMLSTMGAVPGMMMETSNAALRQAPQVAKQFLREERGAVNVGGRGAPPASPPGGTVPPAAPATPPPQPPRPYEPARLPNREETFQSAERLQTDLGTKVDIPEMVAGSANKQMLAGGMRSIPFVGEPIRTAYDKGLRQLETARAAAGARAGTATTPELAGQGVKSAAQNWMTSNSKEITRGLYDNVYNNIDQAATAPLQATSRLSSTLQAAMRESTGTAEQAAVNMVADAVARPGGLTVKGLSALRSEVGEHVDALAVNKAPGQRAMSRLYGALTEDLRAAVQQTGGPGALRAWEVANREARVIAGKRGRLSKIVGIGEDKLSAEAVLEKVNSLGRAKGGNARDLRLIKEVVGEKQFGDMAATLIDRMGFKDDLGVFSVDRFLTEYGKFDDGARNVLFGPAKQHLDDTAMIAMKFQQLASNFNRSNTGIVNAVLKLLRLSSSSGVGMANLATATVNPASYATLGFQGMGLAGGRAAAHALARPSQIAKANKVLKAYYARELAAATGRTVAKHEEAIANSTRVLAVEIARQTGESVEAAQARIRAEIEKGGN